MAKPALAAMRSVDLLNFLIVNPRSAFTLSELSAALGVSPASMSAILVALTEAGYLVRHPRHKTFELGPAVVAAGHSASIRHPIVELARLEMDALVSLGSECVGSAVVGDEIIILAIAGAPASSGHALRVGQRLPLVPPFGLAFLASAPSQDVRRWILRLAPHHSDLDTAVLSASLDVVRSRGFAVGLETERVSAADALIDELVTNPRDETLRERVSAAIIEQSWDYILDEIDPEARYRVNNVAAPIFGADGSVVYVLTVQGFAALSGVEVLEIGRRVSDRCRALTRELGGRMPEHQ